MMLSYMQHKKGEKLMKSIGSFIIAICIIFLNFLFFTGCPSNVENLPPNDIYTGNLILNPSCEDVLVGGEIPYWTEVLSTSWSQRAANPSPHDGSAYFFAGTEANAELSQMVDVSTRASAIDSGTQAFIFEGYVRSYSQSPADSSRIVLEYLDATQTVILDSFDTGEIINTSSWELVSDNRYAPVNTRWIRIRLISRRYNGTNNDGYFDALSLYANQQ